MIYAERIKQARLIAGLTQTQLARAAGTQQASIAYFETGKRTPSLATALAIAFATGVNLGFWGKPPMPPLPQGSLSYRARASAKAMHKETARQYSSLLVEQLGGMARKLNIPQIRFEQEHGNPEEAAQSVRKRFGVNGHSPLPNVVRLLEQNGGVVFCLPMNLDGIDAFSFWVHCDIERPVMVLTTDGAGAGDRRRFTVAHELGHLVMHKGASGYPAVMEKEANLFAAEFLLPAAALRAALTSPLTLESAMQLKMTWKVSIQMIVRRARDLGALSEWDYRQLFQRIGAKGWRTHEPVVIAVERPRLYRQMAETLYPDDCVRGVATEYEIGDSLASRLLEPYAHRQHRS